MSRHQPAQRVPGAGQGEIVSQNFQVMRIVKRSIKNVPYILIIKCRICILRMKDNQRGNIT